MDKIDEKLVGVLDSNPRISLSKLASLVRISQQVADYRLKRLLKKKIITLFGAIINLSSLGLEQYRVFFRFNARYLDINKVLDFLKNTKTVYWAARIGGKYDLLITFFVKDFAEFDQFIDTLNKKFPGLIRDYQACYGLEHIICHHKFASKDITTFSYGYNDKPESVDEVDMLILRELKKNCRTSAVSIAKGKKFTYKTVLNRIKMLEKQKVILGYRLFYSDGVHKPLTLLFSLHDYTKEKERALIAYLKQRDEVTQIIRLFGVWNLFIHIRVKDYEEAQQMIIEARDKFDIIHEHEIIPVFEDITINLLPI